MTTEKEVSFTDVEVVRGNHKVVWEYIGEGLSGEYNPEDPTDTPLLRFSCYEYIHRDNEGHIIDDWEQMNDASYCTRMPPTASLRHLLIAAGIILEAIEDVCYKKRLEELSWFCPEDFKEKT